MIIFSETANSFFFFWVGGEGGGEGSKNEHINVNW